MTDPDIAEMDDARQQLVDRFSAHKPSTWSISLLRTITNAMDIEFGPPDAVERPRLQIIQGGAG